MVASGNTSLARLAVLGFIGALGTFGFTVAAPALVPALVEIREGARFVWHDALLRPIC